MAESFRPIDWICDSVKEAGLGKTLPGSHFDYSPNCELSKLGLKAIRKFLARSRVLNIGINGIDLPLPTKLYGRSGCIMRTLARH